MALLWNLHGQRIQYCAVSCVIEKWELTFTPIPLPSQIWPRWLKPRDTVIYELKARREASVSGQKSLLNKCLVMLFWRVPEEPCISCWHWSTARSISTSLILETNFTSPSMKESSVILSWRYIIPQDSPKWLQCRAVAYIAQCGFGSLPNPRTVKLIGWIYFSARCWNVIDRSKTLPVFHHVSLLQGK